MLLTGEESGVKSRLFSCRQFVVALSIGLMFLEVKWQEHYFNYLLFISSYFF